MISHNTSYFSQDMIFEILIPNIIFHHDVLLARRKEDVLQGEERVGAQEGGRGEGREGRRRGE